MQTMKLLVLGATGGVGVEVVAQAIERGHAVKALVRSPARLEKFAGQISIVQGNLLESDELARAMAGQDVVLSSFGPRVPIAKTDVHLLRDFSESMTKAMKLVGVRRAVVVSTAFLFKDALIPPAYLFGRLFFAGVVADATQMEKILEDSGFDITIVRPPQLTDKPRTGKFRVREGHLPGFGFSIPRADLADFMIQTAEGGAYRSTVVGVCR
jgi:putative NADH-flavin reductase